MALIVAATEVKGLMTLMIISKDQVKNRFKLLKSKMIKNMKIINKLKNSFLMK